MCSIAMATKENMTSQRAMLKSIQSTVNTLASILRSADVLLTYVCVAATVLRISHLTDLTLETHNIHLV